MRKPIVGEKICAVFIGDKRWKSDDYLLPKEVIVTKVGRKYFEVSDLAFDPKFYIDSWGECYEIGGSDWKLYESLQDYLDEKELKTICTELKYLFNGCSTPNVTLEQARKIKSILEESN